MRRPLWSARVRRSEIRAVVGMAVLSLTLFAEAQAGVGEEPVPTDHWAYQTIYELYAGGVWGSWPIGTRPWYRGEIAERVAELRDRARADATALTREQEWQLSKLESEFADLLAPEPSVDASSYRVGMAPRLEGRLERHDDPLLRSRFEAFVGLGQGPWWVRVRGDLDSHGDLDPTFLGRKWKGNLTGTIDLALFSYRKGAVSVLVGRDFVRWGPAGHDALLLNDRSPPFDLARFAFHHEHFDFHYFVTGLDDDFAAPGDSPADVAPDVRRYLAGHRLEVRPWRSLVLGVSEVVVWGGPHRQLEAYYLNPLLPYYWEQLNAGRDDNPLWSIDFAYRFPAGLMIHGEWLIDDFQIDFKSEPHQIGGLVGLNWARPLGAPGGFLTLEWTRIQQTVYGQNRPYNRYLHHRVGIGSSLGPDADRWLARYRQHLLRDLDLTFGFERRRKGERRIDTPQGVGVPFGEPFPSGVAEKTTAARLELLYFPSAHLRAEWSGGFSWQRNAGHAPGTSRDGAFTGLAVTWIGWHLGRL